MSAPQQLSGKCLCGAVTFTASANKSNICVCHCGMCRRWSSGPFMEVTCENVKFSGENNINRFRSSEWAERAFCSRCGSNLFYQIVDSNEYQISVGLLDDQADLTMSLQVFIDSKPAHYSFANKTKTMTQEEAISAFVQPLG